MCLDLITHTVEDLPDAVVAYKAVRAYHSPTKRGYPQRGYLPGVRGTDMQEPKTPGQGWALRDDAYWITAGTNQDYLPGVHAYLTPMDAYREADARFDPLCVVVKVYLRGPIVAGRQNQRPVVVYREMTIIEELD